MPRLFFPILLALALAGCNTVEGAGEDIGVAGNAISDEAQEAENQF